MTSRGSTRFDRLATEVRGAILELSTHAMGVADVTVEERPGDEGRELYVTIMLAAPGELSAPEFFTLRRKAGTIARDLAGEDYDVVVAYGDKDGAAGNVDADASTGTPATSKQSA